jgi:hypothetical protein
MSESASRRQILDDYEKKGIDLPIVTLEMVRDQSEVDDDGAVPATSTKMGFLGRRFGKSETVPPTIDSDDVENAAFVVPPETGGSDALLKNRNSQYQECDADDMPMDEKRSNDEQQPVPPPIPAEPMEEEVSSPFCCPHKLETAAPEQPEVTSEETPTGIFCCAKNEKEHDPHYIKSNLQLPEGFDDEHDASYHDIMNKGSLIDADESVMTTNTEDQFDPMLSKELALGKEDETFWGSRRFRWMMLLCFLLHVALISLIIVVAQNTRKNEEAAIAAPAPETDPMSFESEETLSTDFPMTDRGTLAPTVPDKETQDTSTEMPEEEVTEAPEIIEPVCAETVEVSSSCYQVSSEILVFARSCSPQVGDWVAIYESTEDSTNLLEVDAYDWMFTCGSRTCQAEILSNVLPFAATELLEDGAAQSPLYQVHLMREGDGPFEAIASSAEFRVVGDGRNC